MAFVTTGILEVNAEGISGVNLNREEGDSTEKFEKKIYPF